MKRELALADLVRGTRVAWEWSGAIADLAAAKNVRPIGRVVTHEDLPLMTRNIEIGIQTDDDPLWVISPKLMVAKGRKIFAADEVTG
jgi:hypothetical protein